MGLLPEPSETALVENIRTLLIYITPGDEERSSDVRRVFTLAEKDGMAWKYGEVVWMRSDRLPEDALEGSEKGWEVENLLFDAANVVEYLLDESALSPDYKLFVDFLFQYDVFTAKRDAVALDQHEVYETFFKGSMAMATGGNSYVYAHTIYPDSIVNLARMSPFDRILHSTACFVMEGKTKNMTVDQLCEKINGALRVRFPGWSKGVEEAVRAYSATLLEHLDLQQETMYDNSKWIDFEDNGGEQKGGTTAGHIMLCVRFWLQQSGLFGRNARDETTGLRRPPIDSAADTGSRQRQRDALAVRQQNAQRKSSRRTAAAAEMQMGPAAQVEEGAAGARPSLPVIPENIKNTGTKLYRTIVETLVLATCRGSRVVSTWVVSEGESRPIVPALGNGR
jgi:hypothetical protein